MDQSRQPTPRSAQWLPKGGTHHSAAISLPILSQVMPIHNTVDFLVFTRGHFLEDCSLGRKESALEQNTEDWLRLKWRVQHEGKRRETPNMAGGGGRGEYFPLGPASSICSAPRRVLGCSDVLRYVLRRKCGKPES